MTPCDDYHYDYQYDPSVTLPGGGGPQAVFRAQLLGTQNTARTRGFELADVRAVPEAC